MTSIRSQEQTSFICVSVDRPFPALQTLGERIHPSLSLTLKLFRLPHFTIINLMIPLLIYVSQKHNEKRVKNIFTICLIKFYFNKVLFYDLFLFGDES